MIIFHSKFGAAITSGFSVKKITHSFHTKCRLKTNTGNKSIGCHILEDNGYNYDDNEFKGYLAYIRTYTNLV